MPTEYDVIIIGAGPSGIFCAFELIRRHPTLRVLIIERGHSLEHRVCPKRETGVCAHCNPCSITSGFAGAGAFSDGKLSLSPDVGGYLPDFVGKQRTTELMHETDDIYLDFGADKHVYGAERTDAVAAIEQRAQAAGLSLVACPIRHLGTEEGYKIYLRMQNHLMAAGVNMLFDTPVTDISVADGAVQGVVLSDDTRYSAPRVVAGVGRAGAEWLMGVCQAHGIDTEVGTVDVGVRVETRDEVMASLNENLYEAKLKYRTPTFNDKVRTFCTNPSGEVTSELYDDDLAVANGHAYKSADRKTGNTNFALLVSQRFTKPFKTPIAYGKSVARLANMLCDGSIMIQRLGDLRHGHRTTVERLAKNPLRPTMRDAVPGDLSLAIPHRIMVDLLEMIDALEKVTPGIAADETLLYGAEVKFYSSMVSVDADFETNVSGLFAIGDGASITHGLQQASANGLSVAMSIGANLPA